VIDAVYAMAHALDNMINDLCRGQRFCAEVNPPDGSVLLQYIRNASFIGLSFTALENYYYYYFFFTLGTPFPREPKN